MMQSNPMLNNANTLYHSGHMSLGSAELRPNGGKVRAKAAKPKSIMDATRGLLTYKDQIEDTGDLRLFKVKMQHDAKKAEMFKTCPTYIHGELSNPIGHKTWHEIIESGNPVRPYIDIENYTTLDELDSEKAKQLAEIREVLAGRDYDLFEACGYDAGHAKWKISFHVLFRDIFVANAPAAGEFIKRFQFKECKVDKGIYNKGDVSLRLPYCKKSLGDSKRILQLLDSDNKPVPIEQIGVEDIARFFIQNTEGADFIHIDMPVAKTYTGPAYESKYECSEMVEAIAALTNILPEEYAIEYEKWWPLISGLRSIADRYQVDLRDVAHMVSSRSDEKYNAASVDAQYNREPKDVDTDIAFKCLQKWARESNMAEYVAWQSKYEIKKVGPPSSELEVNLLRSAMTDSDVAEYFIGSQGGNWVNYKKQTYKFNGVYWQPVDGIVIQNMLDGPIYNKLLETLNSALRGDNSYVGIMKKLLNLRSEPKLITYMNVIIRKITLTEDVFDNNDFLVGFRNGTYDLQSNQFREGRKEDYITRTIPRNYEYVAPNDPRMQELIGFIDKVMPVAEERDYLLEVLSTVMCGTTLENFIILTGSGNNGKDTLITYMLHKALGDQYYYLAHDSAITQKMKSDQSVSISNMHKRRMVIYNEPDKNSTICVSVAKALTGCDAIAARTLWATDTTTKLCGTHIMVCNIMPRLDAVDVAIANRIRVIPFRSSFKTQKEIDDLTRLGLQSYVYPVNTKYKTNMEWKEQMCMPLLCLLLEYWKKFHANGNKLSDAPETVKALSKTYLEDSDDFFGWFQDRYELGGADDFLRVKDVLELYKRSDYYMCLSKFQQRKTILKWMVSEIGSNPNLRVYFSARHRPTIDGHRLDITNAIVGWRLRDSAVNDLVLAGPES